MDAIKKGKGRPKGSKNAIQVKHMVYRIPIDILPAVRELIKNYRMSINKQKEILAEQKKPKTKKELLEIIEKLQMQINLPSEK